MPNFSFRLEAVRRYRATLETAAKDAYRDAQRRTFECENDILILIQKISFALNDPLQTVSDRLALESRIARIEEKIQHQNIILQVLQSEENDALLAWVEAKRELEILEKLLEKRVEEWQLEELRKEQAELDEWAVTRRKTV